MGILNEIMTPDQLRNYLAKNKPGQVSEPKKIKAPTEDYVAKMKFILQNIGYKFEQEYKFHSKRKWRFDIAFPEQKIAIEYEGIISKKSRHTSITGFTNDTEKYNAAISLGWKVLRYTRLNYYKVIDDLNENLKK
jgi:hypothetical protein